MKYNDTETIGFGGPADTFGQHNLIQINEIRPNMFCFVLQAQFSEKVPRLDRPTLRLHGLIETFSLCRC